MAKFLEIMKELWQTLKREFFPPKTFHYVPLLKTKINTAGLIKCNVLEFDPGDFELIKKILSDGKKVRTCAKCGEVFDK